MTWLTIFSWRRTHAPGSRSSSGRWTSGRASLSGWMLVSVSESASSDAAMVGDGGMTSGLKYEGAGDPSGVKNCSSWAMISSSLILREGDPSRGGMGGAGDPDEDS